MGTATDLSTAATKRATRSLTGPELRGAESSWDQLYRVVWRWHFYAGLIVAPVLTVMAVTGALYVFKDELEGLVHARLLFAAPSVARASYESQLATVSAAMPEGYHLDQLIVHSDARRTTEFYIHGDEYRRVLVDPHSGELLGMLGPNDVMPVVLKIHRTMFAGTLGRIVVELVTCWTIVLLVSGAYLWWPRKRGEMWGTWLPRWRRHRYVTLRDLHAVSGAYVAAVALLVACTGLLYTYVWGAGYSLAAVSSGAYDIFINPPKSRSAADVARLPMDEIVRVAAKTMPGTTLSIGMPHVEGGAFVVFASSPMGPSSDGVMVIDHATGELLAHRVNSEYPALGWWATWNYPLHVGSVLGLWTKIPWLLACCGLMLLPITGVWMWWQRRPSGQSGFPRKPHAKVPRGVAIGILVLAALLPMLAMSIAAIHFGEKVALLWRAKRASVAA